jgi:Tol biopolymer transport system component
VSVGSTLSFAWAPDGRAITFTQTTDGVPNIWRQPLDGSPAVRLTRYTDRDRIAAHAWSPAGKQLALLRASSTATVVLLKDTTARH